MKGLEIKKEKIAVIGFGISGISVSKYFLSAGIKVDVFEDKSKENFTGEISQEFIENKNFNLYFVDTVKEVDINSYDYIIASPGVPLTHKLIQQAKSSNIEVATDINIFLRIFRSTYSKGKVISVTGSNGKSTTVTLLNDVLKSAGKDSYLGGNIGISPLDFFEKINSDEPLIVLETSSYQLEYLKESDYFDIACILNLSDNHLNRYGGKKELYAKAKLGGIDLKKTNVLINLDDLYTQKYIIPEIKSADVVGIQFEHLNGDNIVTLENDSIKLLKNNESTTYIENVKKMKLKGIHNVYNVAFICGVLSVLEIKTNEKIQNTIYEFSGLIHRMQFVDSINGITFINDSKSTSPDATVKALESIAKDKNVILITGGNDKDISYESMSSVWRDYVRSIVLLPGSANTKLKNLADKCDIKLINEVQTMQEAMEEINKYAISGDIVLLSPATDSHASFKSFEDRGNQFIQCVQNLKK